MAGNVVEILVKGKDQFSPTAKSAQTSAKGLKGAMGGLGKTVLAVGTGFVAAQVGIAGVQKIMSASIGAAMKYEHQMATIRALTGTTAEDTKALDKSIKAMARTMPKSPAELGAGAYFILSSGIEDVTDATNVLEVAARASTIGLGETSKVANALTTVLNAYGMSADKAGHVTDVMIQAVKEGKAEASEFAGVLGRVVPLAAQMGISFEEVAANLATFTRLGVSADEAATGLRQVMASLLKPTKDQEEAMQALGFSAEGLREQIREKGLLAVLGDMTAATGGNEAAIAKLFPNIRALTSVLGTAGVQMEGYTDILKATNNATGNLDEGFKIIADTTQHKVAMAMQELNLILMDLGQSVLPVVVGAARTLSANLEELQLVIGALKGDVDDTNKVLEKSSDDWEDWIGVTQSASATGSILARGLVDLGRGLGIVGKESTLTSEGLAVASNETDKTIEVFQHFKRELRQTAVGEREAAAAAYTLADALKAVGEAQREMMSVLSNITGQRTQETNALDIQINALELERNAALQAEIGQGRLGSAVGSTTDALGRQIGALNNLAASMVPQALNNEIIALDRELKVLMLGKLEIEAQINARNRLAQAQMAMANIANLPALAKQKKLELDRAKILQTVGGDTEKLTDAQKKQIAAIDAEIKALQTNINVKTLEAELTNLQAEASDTNREAMQRELNEIINQIGSTGDLKRQRELYIDTLIPVQLLQDIDALGRQKTALDNSKTGAEGATGATQTLSGVIGDQITKLGLQKDAIDLVTEGWRLQAEAMLDLPKMEDLRKQLLAFKSLLLMQTMQSIIAALSRLDLAAVAQLTAQLGKIAAFQPAQHGFHGDVTRPTLFLAAEAGQQERVDITPGGGGGGGGRTIINHFHFESLVAPDFRQAQQIVTLIMPELERQLT